MNAAEDGLARDSAMTDQVLALKGGATYTTGAQYDKGSWTISGLTKDAHTHANGTLALAHTHSHTHGVGGDGLLTGDADGYATSYDSGVTSSGASTTAVTGATGAQSNATISSSAAWRIKASVGILVYPDI